MRLLIAGGGTGGHVYPGISLAREWQSRDSGNEVAFVGTAQGLEAKVLPREGFELFTISVGRLKGQRLFNKLSTLIGLAGAIMRSYRILLNFRPDLVIGVGGYASGPLALTAWMRGIPTFVQEQNSVPGMTNKILGRLAKIVFISFPEAAEYFVTKKTLLTGNPIRKEIAVIQREKKNSGKVSMLIFGGSQGAHRINATMIEALPRLERIKDRLEITHQTGDADVEMVQRAYDENGFDGNAHAFIYDISDYYKKADFLICRAGATSIAEILCCGLPAIYIPFPFAADNHQEVNARSLVERKAAMMLVESELDAGKLADRILELTLDAEKRAALGMNARTLARPHAAKDIVDQCLDIVGSRN